MRLSRMRSFVIGAVAVLGAAPSVAGTMTMTFDTDPVLSTTQAPDTWYTDRFAPASFESELFDGDNRLLHGIDGGDAQTNSFYNYQGRKFDTGLSGNVQSFSIDLYVADDWDDKVINAGIWATGRDANGDISAYPILSYRNNASINAGFFAYDYFNGGWIYETSVTTFGQWYNLEFVLTVGTGVDYYINGSLIGSFADADTTSLDNVILNAYNSGEDYNVYWDNFTTTSVPEPAMLTLLAAGLLGLGGSRRARG